MENAADLIFLIPSGLNLFCVNFTFEQFFFSRWYFCFPFGLASDGRQRVQLADVVLLPLVPHLMARLHHGLHDHLISQRLVLLCGLGRT